MLNASKLKTLQKGEEMERLREKERVHETEKKERAVYVRTDKRTQGIGVNKNAP